MPDISFGSFDPAASADFALANLLRSLALSSSSRKSTSGFNAWCTSVLPINMENNEDPIRNTSCSEDGRLPAAGGVKDHRGVPRNDDINLP